MQLLLAVHQADRTSFMQLAVVHTELANAPGYLTAYSCSEPLSCRNNHLVFAIHVRNRTRVEQQDCTAGGQRNWARKKRTAGGDDV